MAERNFKLISKYALLLSILYLIEFVGWKYFSSINSEVLSRAEQGLVSTAPYTLTLLLNIIAAIFAYRDKVAQSIKTRYVILATVLYRPLGVVAFLLFALYSTATEEELEISDE